MRHCEARHTLARSLWLALPIALAACGGGGHSGGGGGGGSATYSVGGIVAGLTGAGLVLRNNGGDALTVSANGAFTFATTIANGSVYAVTVATQPAGQTCGVANASGTVSGSAITSVSVTCTSTPAPPPLTLSSSTPATGAIAVARTTSFVLTFSAPIDGATLGLSNVALRGPDGDVPYVASLSGAQLTLSLAGGARLRNAQVYTVTVGTGLHGTGGEAPTAPITITVTSEDGAWSGEMTVSTSDIDASLPGIAADRNGGAALAWGESKALGYEPWGAWTDGKGTWSVQALGGTMNSVFLDVAIDSGGNAFVAWQQGTMVPLRVHATRFAVGGTWSTAAPIDAGVNASGPAVAVDPHGNAIAVWSQGGRIWGNRYTGSSWGTADEVSTINTPGILSKFIGTDSAGNAIVVWDTTPPSQISFARFVAGVGWGESDRIPPGPGGGSSGTPRIAVDGAGNAIAVWSQSDGVRNNLWASRFTPAGGWGAAERIEATTLHPQLSDLATDIDGNAIAVWLQGDAPPFDIVANRYRPGVGWSGAEPLEAGVSETYAVAAVERGGNAIVAWVQGGVAWNRYAQGTGWRGATMLASGDQPSLSASFTGRVYMAYTVAVTAPVHRKIVVRQFE